MPDPANGMGLSGAARMERLEADLQHLMRMTTELKGTVDRMSDRELASNRRMDQHDRDHDAWEAAHQRHVDAHDRRHRGLDFRWYGVVAGMVGAAIYLITQGGPPPEVPI